MPIQRSFAGLLGCIVALTACVEPPPSSTTPTSLEDQGTADMRVDMTPTDMAPPQEMGPRDMTTPDQSMDMPEDMEEACTEGEPLRCSDDKTGYLQCSAGKPVLKTCKEGEMCVDDSEEGGITCAEPLPEPSCLIDPDTTCEGTLFLPGDTSDTMGFQYGRTMELSQDGLHLWISAPQNGNVPDDERGRVHYFNRGSVNEPLTHVTTQLNNPYPMTAIDKSWEIGHSMALSGNGSPVVLCAHRNPHGTPQTPYGRCILQNFDPHTMTPDESSFIVIDAPQEFDIANNPVESTVRFFGSQAEMSPDGKWLVISSRGQDTGTVTRLKGKVFIYRLNAPNMPPVLFKTIEEPVDAPLNFGQYMGVEWTKDPNGDYISVQLTLSAPGPANSTGGKLYRHDASLKGASSTARVELFDLRTGLSLSNLGSEIVYSEVNGTTRMLVSAPGRGGLGGVNNGNVISCEAANCNAIQYPEPAETKQPARFGDALHVDQFGLLWVGAPNFSAFNNDNDFLGEGRVYIYYPDMDNRWTLLTTITGKRIEGTIDETVKFDALGSQIITFEENGRYKALIAGHTSNMVGTYMPGENELGQGQVLLFDLGDVEEITRHITNRISP